MKRVYFLAVATLVTAYSAALPAQGFPSKPVRIVVPFAPGGNVDLVVRGIAPRLSEVLGQQVIADNRPGSSGLLGTHIVAKAPPDGHTLLAMANTFAVVPSIISNPGYDPVRDFAGVSQTCLVPQVLVVNRSLPVRSLKELVALARSRPGEMSYASAGVGGTGHMAAELFNRHAGLKMLHVPYKGNAQAIVDVISGQVTMMFDQVSTSAPHIRAGKLKPLAVTSLRRSPLFPDLPTIDESGVRGFEDITSTASLPPRARRVMSSRA
jgi:tripartite-type tricarboxylate transporter receptor subunit TctC